MNFKNGSIRLLDDFFEFARVGAFILIAIWFYLEKKKPSKLTWILFAMEVWQLFVTCITNKKIVVSIYDLSASLAIALLIELFLDSPKDLLGGMLLHYELAVYPNLITLLMNIGSENDNFYLGDHNVVNQFFIPAIAVAVIYMYITGNKKRSLPLIVISLVSCYLSHSSTTIVAISFAITCFVFGYIVKNKDISIGVVFVITLIPSIFLLFFYSESIFPELSQLVIKIFDKTLAFSGREYIWPVAMQMILESPLIGHGYRTTIFMNWNFTAGHAHNMLLDKALVGGFPELLIFLYLHVELFLRARKIKPSICKLTLVSLMGAIFVTYIMDSYLKFWRFYVVIFLLYHLDDILKDKVVVKDEKK